jgi:putative transposase
MKRARFTEEPIIGAPREHEAEAKTADLARKRAVSATLYNWKGPSAAAWTRPGPACRRAAPRHPLPDPPSR